jgi:hypothetical protein
MGKPALGKGMKDLLGKNIGISKKEPPKDKDNVKKELKTNIDRYQAQEFDVTLLRDLKGKDPEIIQKGIESYRDAIKKLNSAQTVVRSLEGYGYKDELELIKKKLKDPTKADSLMVQVEELRERALTEHNVKVDRKEAPRVKLPENLKAQSEKISQMENDIDEEIDLDSLDGMLSDLNDIGDAFDLEIEKEADPMLEKIEAYESEGYFVDRLKALINEDKGKVAEQMVVFEDGIKEMRELKDRLRKMDLSEEFAQQAEEMKIKFQYPHMASEIKNELDAIDKKIEDALKAAMPPEEPPEEAHEPEPVAEPEAPEEPVAEDPPEETIPQPEAAPEEEPAPEPVPEEPPQEEAPQEAPEQDETPGEEIFPDLSLDDLLDKAKEVYRDGDLELSLRCFQEILRRDPDNSKARFMIRRLTAKQ